VLYAQECRIVSTGSLQQCFLIKLFHKRTLFHCNTSEPYHPSMIKSVFPCGNDSPGQQFFTGRSAGLLPCAGRSTVFVAKFFHKRTLFHCTSEPYHKSMLESVLPEVVAGGTRLLQHSFFSPGKQSSNHGSCAVQHLTQVITGHAQWNT